MSDACKDGCIKEHGIQNITVFTCEGIPYLYTSTRYAERARKRQRKEESLDVLGMDVGECKSLINFMVGFVRQIVVMDFDSDTLFFTIEIGHGKEGGVRDGITLNGLKDLLVDGGV